MKGYPTLEEIRKDYESLYEKIKDIDTLEKLAKVWWTTTEVNGMDDWRMEEIKQSEIDWFRYEQWGCLDYIYVYFENGKITDIKFDVWCDKHEFNFIEFETVEHLTEELYNKYINDTELYMLRNVW